MNGIFFFHNGQGVFVLASGALLILVSCYWPPSLFFDVHTLCVGGERLAVVHHYTYIYITCTFHLHAHWVVDKMCVTILCRGITSRLLAALTTSLCQSKEIRYHMSGLVRFTLWHPSGRRVPGLSRATEFTFSLRFTNFLVEMLWCTAWDNFYLHIYMGTYIYIHT